MCCIQGLIFLNPILVLLYGLGSVIESLACPCHKAALYQKQREQLAVLWELLLMTSVDVEYLGKGMVKAQQVRLFLLNSSYIAREVNKRQYQGVNNTRYFLLSAILGWSEREWTVIHSSNTKEGCD
jgi:hypothetical protein